MHIVFDHEEDVGKGHPIAERVPGGHSAVHSGLPPDSGKQ
jgi:hypothetical protein